MKTIWAHYSHYLPRWLTLRIGKDTCIRLTRLGVHSCRRTCLNWEFISKCQLQVSYNNSALSFVQNAPNKHQCETIQSDLVVHTEQSLCVIWSWKFKHIYSLKPEFMAHSVNILAQSLYSTWLSRDAEKLTTTEFNRKSLCAALTLHFCTKSKRWLSQDICFPAVHFATPDYRAHVCQSIPSACNDIWRVFEGHQDMHLFCTRHTILDGIIAIQSIQNPSISKVTPASPNPIATITLQTLAQKRWLIYSKRFWLCLNMCWMRAAAFGFSINPTQRYIYYSVWS